MAKLYIYPPNDIEIDTANSAPVQFTMRAVAVKGGLYARALALPTSETGEYRNSIGVGRELVTRGRKPVNDYLVEFNAPYAAALEYGHWSSGSYDHVEKRVPGVRIAHRTLKMMGG